MSNMINNRRRFLFGAAALLAAPAIAAIGNARHALAAAFDRQPKLWGDGIHDDSAALQWIVDHTKGDTIYFPSGTFYISGSVDCDRIGCAAPNSYGQVVRGPITITGGHRGTKFIMNPPSQPERSISLPTPALPLS